MFVNSVYRLILTVYPFKTGSLSEYYFKLDGKLVTLNFEAPD